MSYCTIDDVLSVAQDYKQDVTGESPSFNTETISTTEITAIIDESTIMVQSLLQPRYSRDTINSYGSNFPPVIVYLTKTYSALLLYERYGSQSTEKNWEIIKKLKRTMEEYRRIIANGDLIDADGIKVPTAISPVMKQDGIYLKANEEIYEVYKNGRFY